MNKTKKLLANLGPNVENANIQRIIDKEGDLHHFYDHIANGGEIECISSPCLTINSNTYTQVSWEDDDIDEININTGLCYRTEEGAQAFLDAVGWREVKYGSYDGNHAEQVLSGTLKGINDIHWIKPIGLHLDYADQAEEWGYPVVEL